LKTSLLIRLSTQLESLKAVLEGGEMHRKPAPDKWSALEILAHLARYHEVFLDRIRRILAEDGPRFDRYRAETDPLWHHWRELPLDEVLSHAANLRVDIAKLFEQLSQRDLQKVGIHPGLGSLSIPMWLEFFLLHEAHHLYQAMNRARGND
jgi:uncharacterized damage-inducible protein DinB